MKEELFIVILLLLGPILDVFAFYQLPFNIFFRVIYLLFIILMLLKRKNNSKILLLLLLYSIIEFIFQKLYLDYSFSSIISSILKFLYLPLSILYFKDIEFKKYKLNRILTVILYTYTLIFLLSYITKIGVNIYTEADGKSGFKGIFASINEFSAIIVGILPIVSVYLKEKKNYILLILIFILTILCSLLLGTKVLFGGIIFTLFYLLFQERKVLFFNRTKLQKIIMIVVGIILLICFGVIFTKTRTYQNMLVQQKFFKVNNIFSYEYINKVIFNDRLSFFITNFNYFKNTSILNFLLGIGFNNSFVKMNEIDIFDILFRYGILGLILFIFLLTKIPFKNLSKECKLSIIILFFVSLTSGHVLFYPSVCIYIGLLSSCTIEKK